MELKMPYKDLNHALKLFRVQVSESIPYAMEEFPVLSSPRAVFNYLKPRTLYKKDPRNTELFQSLPTLMENNFHGITGAGDCDCFTIAALATLIANGFTDCGIVLVGRKPSPFPPVHIYAYVMEEGERRYLDLTNGSYNYERRYPYKQHVPYQLNQQEKDMMLQLADGPPKPRGGAGYIYIPSQGVHIREDYFDGMSAAEFQNMCLSEGVGPDDLQELSGRRSERKAAKKENKQAKRAVKLQKKKAKADKKQSKADKRRAEGEAKKMKAQAKITRASQPGGGGGGLRNVLNMFKTTAPSDDEEATSPDDSDDSDYSADMLPDDSGQDDSTDTDVDTGGDDSTDMQEAGSYVGPILGGLLILGFGYAVGNGLKRRRRAA